MEKDTEKTDVRFLIHPNAPDEVYAYFPYEKYDAEGKYRMCYAHLGQHSGCDPDYAKESIPALPEQYDELYKELGDVGYTLNVL
jgi:hypothetical protein